MAIYIVKRNGTWQELTLEAMKKAVEHCLGFDELQSIKGMSSIISKKHIEKTYMSMVKSKRNERFNIINSFIQKAFIHIQDITFIIQNLLLQTTYYKLNTTRP